VSSGSCCWRDTLDTLDTRVSRQCAPHKAPTPAACHPRSAETTEAEACSRRCSGRLLVREGSGDAEKVAAFDGRRRVKGGGGGGGDRNACSIDGENEEEESAGGYYLAVGRVLVLVCCWFWFLVLVLLCFFAVAVGVLSCVCVVVLGLCRRCVRSAVVVGIHVALAFSVVVLLRPQVFDFVWIALLLFLLKAPVT